MEAKWIDKAKPIRKGEELNLAKLQQYIGKNLPDTKGELVVEQFPSGFSNLTYLIRMGEREMVLRRPPFGANIKSGHDMSREFRILSALEKHYAKVPKPLLFCENPEVLGADFYIMERVHGVILRPKMPKEMHPEPALMGKIGMALIDDFVKLHALEYEEIGLGTLGKPEGYVKRQIEGWTRRYHKAKTDEIPGMEALAKWLADHMPPESDQSLIHNDYKYDNLVLDANDWSKVIAILDWEMATLGDPLMDLGTSLGYWVDDNDPPAMKMLQLSPTLLPGNPTRADVAQQYAEKSGRTLDHLVFYYV